MAAERIELEIVRVGARGDGIAIGADGQPIYVPLTLPGERVRARASGGRAEAVDILRASPHRVRPACPHFGRCGGCAAQHMGPDAYRQWKRDLVAGAFAHRGIDAEIADPVVVAPGTRRRAVLTAVRDQDGVRLGFHAAGSHEVVAIEHCPVLAPRIAAALACLRQLAEAALPAAGDARLTVIATPAGLDVDLRPAAPLSAQARIRLSQLAAAARLARLSIAGEPVLVLDAPTLRLGDAQVALPPAAFVQATAEAEAALTDIVLGAVGKARRVADLFAGLGTFTFPLARRARVLAIDGDRAAIGALGEAARRTPGLKPMDARVRDLFRDPLSRKELEDLDAVVFDPPRAGARAQAEALARSRVPTILAVSCDPATLARDVRTLIDGGWRLERVTPIDQFVWSAEIEAVAVLRR